MLRVVYVSPFTDAPSGADESLLPVVADAAARGAAVTVVLPREGTYLRRYREAGACVVVLPLARVRRTRNPVAWLGFALRAAVEAPRLAGLLRRERASLVHANMEVVPQAGIAGRLAGVPVVCHYRGNTRDSPRWAYDLLLGLWARLAVRVIAISEATAELFRRRGLGDLVTVVPNPVVVPGQAAATRRASEVPVVGTVGRIHPRKRLEVLLEAAARVHERAPEVRVAITGSTLWPEERRYLASLHQLARRLGLDGKVSFCGYRPDGWAAAAGLDVFVLTALDEGFGRVLVEAMAAGTPVVAVRSGAVPEVVGEAGVLVEPDDPDALAGAIVGLLADRERHAALAAAGRERVRTRFDPAASLAAVRRVYAEVLGPGRAGA